MSYSGCSTFIEEEEEEDSPVNYEEFTTECFLHWGKKGVRCVDSRKCQKLPMEEGHMRPCCRVYLRNVMSAHPPFLPIKMGDMVNAWDCDAKSPRWKQGRYMGRVPGTSTLFSFYKNNFIIS